MDPRVEHALEGLRHHWIALAGVGVAAILGGGSAKLLAPSELYHAPSPMLEVSGPPGVAVDYTPQQWPGGRIPSYVIDTDMIYPPQHEVTPLPVVDASYETLRDSLRFNQEQTAALNERLPDAYQRAGDAIEVAAYQPQGPDETARSADQAVAEDTAETYPALAPG